MRTRNPEPIQRYDASEKRKASRRRYRQTAKGKAATKRYAQGAKGKATQARYQRTAKAAARSQRHEAKRVRSSDRHFGTAQTHEDAQRINAHIRQRLHAFKQGFAARAEMEALATDTVSL